MPVGVMVGNKIYKIGEREHLKDTTEPKANRHFVVVAQLVATCRICLVCLSNPARRKAYDGNDSTLFQS